ncbi:uncharacterized protein B0H18DRAFT_1027866 [Fomitopsis serialis]|uniref:uncharacterized protein n=1 Tax=Fomitopsis serialis TaxID=139415 RepID=UPI0020073A36|nr:uncharacterized protein B0H18DRAFT_1027866 [Neoantrodia serialis]KAH9919386.1 hypothetical protein B0H18DRAFT_1027866 [Neoantrodia serialis]
MQNGDAIYSLFDDTCKQVVSYWDRYRLLYKRGPTQAQLCEHFVVTLAETASSCSEFAWGTGSDNLGFRLTPDQWYHFWLLRWPAHFCFRVQVVEQVSESAGESVALGYVDCLTTLARGNEHASQCEIVREKSQFTVNSGWKCTTIYLVYAYDAVYCLDTSSIQSEVDRQTKDNLRGWESTTHRDKCMYLFNKFARPGGKGLRQIVEPLMY